MANFFPYILAAQKQCIESCALLIDCLKEERTALISLEMETIIQNNLKKEGLTFGVRRKQEHLLELVRAHYGCDDLNAMLGKISADDANQWKQRMTLWKEQWEEVERLCKRNQSFIQHSLKNLGLIVVNLRRLLGTHSTYSSNGSRVDQAYCGKVVEARY